MKNIIIAALVGISFLTSGFMVGLRLAPMPKKPVAAVAKTAPKPVDPKVAFSIESLKKASENIATLNDTLQARERALATREKTISQKEDELVAERAALDRLHAHFKGLYSEFEKRLQLVTDDETAALQRQVTVYSTMDSTQSVDLIRALDDSMITRLFVLMDDKALTKIVAAWKVKYPTETTRLLTDLNGMGRVVAKDKIRLPDGAPVTDTATPAPPASSDVSTPPGAPAADAAANPDTTPAASDAAPANAPAATPATDTTPASTDSSTPAAPTTPTPDAATPEQDQTTPPPASAPKPTAPAAPAANSSSASTSGDLLGMPGEAAAKAAGQDVPESEEPAPAHSKPATSPMHLAHEKPVRFASARTN